MRVLGSGVVRVRCGFCGREQQPDDVDVVEDAGAVVCDGCLEGLSALEGETHPGEGLVGAGVELDVGVVPENDAWDWCPLDLEHLECANDDFA